jgi:serine/threonine-protein kinase
VTEFLRGCTLDRLARKAGPLREDEALGIVSLIAAGLVYMHERGFIHRDIKPGNVMICTDRTLRILDFGLASRPMRHRALAARLTTPFGTPQYMAPEQVEQGLIDERTDVYCLGAVLYELLTGMTPLQGEDAWESAYRRTTGDPVAPRKLNPAISAQAEEIVLHALQRDAAGRYPGMAAFKADLDAPGKVSVTGYRDRLRPPRWKLSLHATPVLAGLVLGFSFLSLMVVGFVVLRLVLQPR